MSWLDLISPQECQQLASAFLGSSVKVLILTVDVHPLDGPRGGYMSDHLLIKLNVKIDDLDERELRFFAKSMPRVPIHKEYVESTRFYVKETAFYSSLLKDLRAAQGDGGQDRWVPVAYFVRDDLIIQEDLTLQNYAAYNESLMNVEYSELVLRELANFHAASIVLEEKNRSCGDMRSLKQVYPIILEERSGSSLKMDGQHGWFQASVRSLVQLIVNHPKYNVKGDVIKKIREEIPKVCEVMNTIVSSSSKYRNVVLHADIWAKNIMIRKSDDNRPIAVRFVDFQLVRYAPPACDLITFLYLLTDLSFRKRYKGQMLHYYYSEMTKELRRHNLDPEKMFPRSEFEETCEYYNVLGVVLAAVALPMLLLPAEIADEYFKTPEEFVQFMLVDRSKEILKRFETCVEYRHRITEILDEFVDTCLKHVFEA